MAGTESVRLVRSGASVEQLRAVYQVMRILAIDDRQRGTPATKTVLCAACRRSRPSIGSVDYGGTRLCNGCATDYEVLRMAALVDDVQAFLQRPAPVTRAG
jgi:hypothetical protein